ncbi:MULTISPECIES: SPOR domain-containing protein [Halomonadaceae]|uniref:SPOR domain-containing protein n=1 Tax=Vreelandella piezotolerans TaxID=2609667 RepID=A0ABQ6XBA3_9GAMM|nr:MULTISPECIES: SPOR domain-containing protein [Halomonas]KFC51133.1 sporulation protein [Halomonas sp. SUBG004]KAE8439298.1 SPOR domain-containing protein [Halomonas piezotolerans]MCG7575967.1 SPOR domain-containing protein [Halomonas sp. MMH1-48]MCG7591124.1 SPOR domain-containing protein [Halomonas sp. McD50-5]MCG7603254.1 SPOR domain-containing protein [Halomonas sp. MM17-34]
MASPRNKPARRGATTQRKSARRSGGGLRLPGWLWGIAGVAAGFFLAQHQHGTAPWQEQREAPQATVLPKPAGSDERSAARQTETPAEQAMPTFEFYTLLPETEVIAPGGAIPSNVTPPTVAASDEDTGSDTATTDPSESTASTPGSAADDPIAQVIAANTRPSDQASAVQQSPASATNRYMLQAASFRELSDAEQLRSRLRNLSLLAQISEVQANGDTWHRVQVGPYDDTRELNRAQDLMSTQGIEPLLIQLQN